MGGNVTGEEKGEKSVMKDSTSRAHEIYRIAAEVIMTKGFEATSMNEIAKAVNLTKAGLYHYISGKQHLLYAIIDFAMDAIETEVVKPARRVTDPEDRLRQMLWNHIHLLTDHGTHVSILTDEVTSLTPAHREDIVARKRAYLNYMRETLQELKDAGRMRELDVGVAALNILASIVGMARWYQPHGKLNLDDVAKQTIDFVLRGLLVD